jgi:hypothetical protein
MFIIGRVPLKGTRGTPQLDTGLVVEDRPGECEGESRDASPAIHPRLTQLAWREGKSGQARARVKVSWEQILLYCIIAHNITLPTKGIGES